MPGPTKSRGVNDFLNDLAKADGTAVGKVEEEFFKTMRPGSLIQRFATPEEIANMITYLVSPLASATNGAAVRADGGLIRSII
jgi:NAD(P)-dependent dehydrogenase (short-subunit alcohol dehydrogenase family)